jgi:hypothetical protein
MRPTYTTVSFPDWLLAKGRGFEPPDRISAIKGLAIPRIQPTLPPLQICFLCVLWAWNHHLSAAALNI